MPFKKPPYLCLHCKTHHRPLRDGRCPKCCKVVRSISSDNPNFSLVSIRDGDQFPSSCMMCGGAPDGLKLVSHKMGHFKEVEEDQLMMVSALASVVVPGAGLMRFIESKVEGESSQLESIDIRIPICVNCQEDERLRQSVYDEKNASLSFTVHKTFRNEFESLNDKPKPSVTEFSEVGSDQPSVWLYMLIPVCVLIECISLIYGKYIIDENTRNNDWMNVGTIIALALVIVPFLAMLGSIFSIRNWDKNVKKRELRSQGQGFELSDN